MEYTPVYPEDIAREAYEAALEKCVFGGGWLFNQSDMDVWFDFEGFVVKIPAGTRVRPDGWTLVRNQVLDIDTEKIYACPTPVTRSGFKFCNNRRYIYNILVVFSPDTAGSTTSYFGVPGRTLEEHIALINTMKLDKAMIIAEDLSFLPRCPSLKTIYIRYAQGLDRELDLSPVYALPNLESISIVTAAQAPRVHIDFTRLPWLRHVSLCTNDRYNFHLIPGLESLTLSYHKRYPDLTTISCSPCLKKLDLQSCGMKSLAGIGQYPLETLFLDRMRGLEDISALSRCAGSLRHMSIEACGKIRDFSCLRYLHNLEYLNLQGSQVLPDLEFLREMPNLKVFTFSMIVANADLTPCLSIPYAYCSRMKRHYNVKEKELSQDRSVFPVEVLDIY